MLIASLFTTRLRLLLGIGLSIQVTREGNNIVCPSRHLDYRQSATSVLRGYVVANGYAIARY